eukprot:PhF_6_TR16576/c0_g1_i1/m.25261
MGCKSTKTKDPSSAPPPPPNGNTTNENEENERLLAMELHREQIRSRIAQDKHEQFVRRSLDIIHQGILNRLLQVYFIKWMLKTKGAKTSGTIKSSSGGNQSMLIKSFRAMPPPVNRPRGSSIDLGGMGQPQTPPSQYSYNNNVNNNNYNQFSNSNMNGLVHTPPPPRDGNARRKRDWDIL